MFLMPAAFSYHLFPVWNSKICMEVLNSLKWESMYSNLILKNVHNKIYELR